VRLIMRQIFLWNLHGEGSPRFSRHMQRERKPQRALPAFWDKAVFKFPTKPHQCQLTLD
jgi:hypothetical protein